MWGQSAPKCVKFCFHEPYTTPARGGMQSKTTRLTRFFAALESENAFFFFGFSAFQVTHIAAYSCAVGRGEAEI